MIFAYSLECELTILVGRMELQMSGTHAGGKKAAATNKAKYGKDFYAEIGRKGGRNGHTG